MISGIGAGLSSLFPDASGRRVATRRGLLLAALAVVVGAVISLLRTTGTGPLQSIWEEDARNILNDALNTSGANAVTNAVAGYYVIGPRLLGELATLFPISWAAAVLSISSAVITALLALQVYVASGSQFSNPLARVLVSAPLLFAPAAENVLSEVYNRPVCLHFFAMYALFWLFLWTPRSRAGKAGLLITIGMTAVSTVLIVGYLPLALLRVFVRRDRLSLAALGLVAAGTAVQFGGLQLGLTERATIGTPRLDAVWALAHYVFWAVPNSVLGFDATEGLSAFSYNGFNETLRDNVVIIAVAWLVVLVIAAAAVVGARRGLLRPQWWLAGLAAGYSFFLLVMMIVGNGAIAQRYVMPAQLLIFVALVAMLVPAEGVDIRKAGAFLAAFAVFVGVIAGFNYRWDNTYRHNAPVWTDQLRAAAKVCQRDPRVSHVVVRGGPQPWWSIVTVPCQELKKSLVCVEPECVWLDPPRSMGRQRHAQLEAP